MNVNYELYKVFFVVAGSNSITEASKKLYISQPAITKSIKKLEGQLHTTLFVRSPKGTKLSKEGQKFYNKIKPAIERLLEAENELSMIDTKITIGVDDIFIQRLIGTPLKKFIKLNRKDKLYIKENKTNNLIDNILNDKIDIGVSILDLGINQDNKLNAYKLTDLDLCLVGNTLIKNEVKTNNISRLEVICTNPNLSQNKNKIIVDNYSQVKELINQNLGIGIIPKEFIHEELENNKLFIIENNISNISLYILTNSQTLNVSVIKLKNLIIEEMKLKEKI